MSQCVRKTDILISSIICVVKITKPRPESRPERNETETRPNHRRLKPNEDRVHVKGAEMLDRRL